MKQQRIAHTSLQDIVKISELQLRLLADVHTLLTEQILMGGDHWLRHASNLNPMKSMKPNW